LVLAGAGTAQDALAATPGVTPSIIGLAGDSGWYRSPVTVRWEVGTDGLVSTTGCEAATLLTADTSGVTEHCQATYTGGVILTGQALIKIDQTPPTAVRALPAAAPNADGWFNSPVTVDWSGVDDTSGIAGCTSTAYAGPDGAGVPLTGTCRDQAGNVSAPAGFALDYDATPPVVTGAAPARAPDHAGWYLRPVAFALEGQDAGSGIESCDTITYAGADGDHAMAAGACRDRAGNSATGGVPLRYDGTAPALTGVRAIVGRRVIRLRWRASRDAERVVVTRSPGLRGRRATVVYRGRRSTFTDTRLDSDVRYTYSVTAVDAHAKTSTTRVTKTFSLMLAPRRGAHVRGPVVLRWRAASGARFYNVQIYRGTRLVANRYPTARRLRVSHLRPGRYRWYVWPGYGGSRADARYGRLLGQSRFSVR
jgi:hypothetical protein